jgi:hypothetical protein
MDSLDEAMAIEGMAAIDPMLSGEPSPAAGEFSPLAKGEYRYMVPKIRRQS